MSETSIVTAEMVDLDALEAVAKAGNALDSATCQALIARLRRAEATLKQITRKMPAVLKPAHIPLTDSAKCIAWTQGVNDCADYYVSLAEDALAPTQKDPAP